MIDEVENRQTDSQEELQGYSFEEDFVSPEDFERIEEYKWDPYCQDESKREQESYEVSDAGVLYATTRSWSWKRSRDSLVGMFSTLDV